jgi:D-cysteine desulfhydrase
MHDCSSPSGAALAIERLRARPRAGLGTFPTEVEKRRGPLGEPLWIKRDDLSGLGRGGAKARKIDLLIGHMLTHGYDELITVAGNVTNLAFDLLPALRRFGLRASLFIADEPRLAPAARERLFAGVRDGVQLTSASHAEAAVQVAAAWTRARAAGRRPFALLPGAAHPIGVLGNALGFLELADQLEARGEPLPSAVLVTAATGTTLAGFVLAEALLRASGRAPVRVIGVQAYGRATRAQTLALLRWSARALGLALRIPAVRVELDPRALAGGFGRFTPEQAALCAQVERSHGLTLDPIFGGKTWSVLEARAEEFARTGRPPLYWHCGFTPEWAELGVAVQRGAA